MQHPLDGKGIRDIRTGLGMSSVEFALLLGVTIRTVELWETDVVAPSRITAMVIRAAAERARAAATLNDAGDGRVARRGRADRPRTGVRRADRLGP